MGENGRLNVCVLGAGPSGLCAAWNLVRDGHRVTVLEKENVWGGQSLTFERDGFRYDLGPHNIHSQRRSVIDFLKKNIGPEFISHEFFAEIYFRSRRIRYPFMGSDVLHSLHPLTAAACAVSFAGSRLRSFFIPAFRDDGGYEKWIVNRFGRKFYEIYFAPYSEKIWGVPPAELSDVIAKKRIAVRGILELVHMLLFKRRDFHPENPTMIDNYYPRRGVGAIADFFAKGILEGGGQIRTGCRVEAVELEGRTLKAVRFLENGKTDRIASEGPEPLKVLSTIPVNDLASALEGEMPGAVREAASGLDYTSEIFLYLNLRNKEAFGVPLLYFSEPEFPFNRIYDNRLFSPATVPEGKNALCVEMTCGLNDRRWNASDTELAENCIAKLEAHGLLKRDDVEAFHTRRLTHAYPRFRIGYETKLKTLFAFFSGLDNLITFGRQGLFSYANVDDAIWMGFEVAKHLRYQDRISLTPKELLPDYISF